MVEYLKTIGEEIGPSLQQLASGVQDILNPNRKYQVMLKESLAKNPELIGQLATVAKDNPGALEGVFGKGSAGFFQSLHETPKASLERSMAGATQGAIKGNEEDVGRVALGLPTKLAEKGQQLTQEGQVLQNAGQTTQNARNAVSLERETAVSKFMASMPEEQRNDVMFKDLTGMLGVDYKKAQVRATAMTEAQPWIDASPKDIRKAYKSGQISDSALQGLWDLHPGAMNMIMKDMESDDAWAMRAAIAKDAQKNRRLDIMSTLYQDTAKRAQQLGVKPAALFQADYGYSPDEVVPNSKSQGITPEDVTAATKASQQAFKSARSKSLMPVLGIYNSMTKKGGGGATPGAAAIFNAAADAAGIDLRVEIGQESHLFGAYHTDTPKFMWNGQQIDKETAAKILSGETPGVNTGITPPTEKPTTSEKELSGNTKTLYDAAKAKGFDWDTVKSSKAFAALPPAEQQALQKAMGK